MSSASELVSPEEPSPTFGIFSSGVNLVGSGERSILHTVRRPCQMLRLVAKALLAEREAWSSTDRPYLRSLYACVVFRFVGSAGMTGIASPSALPSNGQPIQ